ncbi:CLUMA_CG001615, isoform A [Clunio marinus]|uniref:CLUMA_CG001615, isoform A n=1 Tax=Clunio marinus TaxID=568069 RepID=A0A1J1HIT4_9DIPT|nr:CLUMA_CG001615, isoform A [Clunio marinus]
MICPKRQQKLLIATDKKRKKSSKLEMLKHRKVEKRFHLFILLWLSSTSPDGKKAKAYPESVFHSSEIFCLFKDVLK